MLIVQCAGAAITYYGVYVIGHTGPAHLLLQVVLHSMLARMAGHKTIVTKMNEMEGREEVGTTG